MFSQGEVVNLILGLAMLPALISSRADSPTRYTRYYVAGYAFVLASNIATVLEGYFAPDLFNVVEHSTLAFAGVTFAVLYALRRAELAEAAREA